MTCDEAIEALRALLPGTPVEVTVSLATFADSDEGAQLSSASGTVLEVEKGRGPLDGAFSLRMQDEHGSVEVHPPLFTGGDVSDGHIEIHHGVVVTRITMTDG
jgi:hypothetical protein